MILIKKIQTVCSCKDREKSWFTQIFPHIILAVSIKNRSFAAEIDYHHKESVRHMKSLFDYARFSYLSI